MGRTYADAEQLRAVFSEMFDDVADDDGMDGVVAQQMVINFRLHDPSIDIWVDGRTRPVATTFAPIGVDATLTAELSADSMHELLLGTLPLGKAVLVRKLKVSGSALPQAQGVGLEVTSTQARATPARLPGRLPRDRRQTPVGGGALGAR